MKSNIQIGQTFGRWEVISLETKLRWAALCKCECGTVREIYKGHLSHGDTHSCGCLQKDVARKLKTIHGQRAETTATYSAWSNMKARCGNKSHPNYLNYGARGITVCDRWLSNFPSFADDMGNRPVNGTLERKDTNGNYCPENCHWVVHKTNCQNTRTSKFWHINGRTFESLNDAAKALGVSASTVLGWCEGYTRNGRFYPPRDICYSEAKYV